MKGTREAIRSAMALATAGQTARALDALRRLVARSPSDADAAHHLGLVLLRSGEVEQALHHLRRSVELDERGGPAARAPLLANLGIALAASGDHAGALREFEAALSADEGYAPAHLGRAHALTHLLEFDGAIESARRATVLRPADAGGWLALAGALEHAWRLDESVEAIREGLVRTNEDARLLRALVVAMHFRSEADPAEHEALHARLGARIAAAALGAGRGARRPPARARALAGRRLRVGYLSPDFRDHAVARFIGPVFAGHDRERVEVVCVSDVARADATTARLRASADRWIDSAGMDDDNLDAAIRREEIDVLVDLAGHTAGNRLGVMARRPAAAQATYLGYPGVTGVPGIGWRIVDSITDPPTGARGTVERGGATVERLVRLPGCFVCFDPGELAALEVGDADASKVVFGSMGVAAKMGAGVVESWSRVLRETPGSRLVLKSWVFGAEATRRAVASAFAARGIEASRLEMLGHTDSHAEHVGVLRRVTIVLDPFPYNGTTTTCEALWMGVPVVALRGDRHAGRVGSSLLTAAGVPELIAGSVEEYESLAIGLARDPARVSAYRASLRGRMAASALCDGAGMARRLEEAFLAMHAEAAGAV